MFRVDLAACNLKMHMKIIYVALIAIFLPIIATADGLPISNGRYQGPVVVLDLTTQQKETIEHYRICQLEQYKTMNIYTPYVFTLTPSQSKEIKAKKGYSPRYFNVYETVRGFNDGGPHWNLVLRFSEDQVEVPLDLIMTDRRAKLAVKEMGWKLNNPCFPNLSYQRLAGHGTTHTVEPLSNPMATL